MINILSIAIFFLGFNINFLFVKSNVSFFPSVFTLLDLLGSFWLRSRNLPSWNSSWPCFCDPYFQFYSISTNIYWSSLMCQTLGYHHSFMNSFINIHWVLTRYRALCQWLRYKYEQDNNPWPEKLHSLGKATTNTLWQDEARIQVQTQGLWSSEKESIASLWEGGIRCIAQCLAHAKSSINICQRNKNSSRKRD